MAEANNKAPAPAKGSTPNNTAGAGETRTTDDLRREREAESQRISTVSDATGQRSNRVEGTIQSEPTPEEFPSDAKVTPLAEQQNPNGNVLVVGAKPQPEEIAGVKQPEEGKKVLTSDMSDAADFMPSETEQSEDARLATEVAKRDAERGRLGTATY